MSATMSKGARMQADLTALLRARHSLLWLLTREEVRVERMLTEAANAAGYVVQFWDCVAGITDAAGKTVDGNMRDPTAAIANILASDARVVWCMRDLHRWFDPVVLRALRNAARALQVRPKDKAAAIVILTPSGEVPPELAGHATVIEAPLPDRSEIAVLFDDVLRALPETLRAEAAPNGVRDAAIDAAVGLSAEEAANCYAKSLV
ncbi:MAG: hypothetical protein FJ265_23115, partial [Planctomycetes bacterium]|nr:hypothetical protein [Planctomycetota bacterium]